MVWLCRMHRVFLDSIQVQVCFYLQALASTLAFGLTGLMGLFSVTLTLSVVGIYTGLAAAAFAGTWVNEALSLHVFLAFQEVERCTSVGCRHLCL